MLNQDLIATLTSAAVAFGSAHCAVPNVDVSVNTTGTDLQGVGARWSAKMTLTDKVEAAAGTTPYSREWSVSDQDTANVALDALANVVMRDFETMADALHKKLAAIGEACGILFEAIETAEPGVVSMAATVTPAR